ncbi:unnamed protein product [Boreogadus saida]
MLACMANNGPNEEETPTAPAGLAQALKAMVEERYPTQGKRGPRPFVQQALQYRLTSILDILNMEATTFHHLPLYCRWFADTTCLGFQHFPQIRQSITWLS